MNGRTLCEEVQSSIQQSQACADAISAFVLPLRPKRYPRLKAILFTIQIESSVRVTQLLQSLVRLGFSDAVSDSASLSGNTRKDHAGAIDIRILARGSERHERPLDSRAPPSVQSEGEPKLSRSLDCGERRGGSESEL